MTCKQLVELIGNKPCLTKQDLAIRFAHSVRTIERWRKAGKLPKAFKVTGPLWRPVDIENFTVPK